MVKRIVSLLAMLAMVALTAAPALAHHGPPEEPGVETGVQHARSICSFSGLNDFSEGPGPRTQSYGQEVKHGGVPHPSVVKSGEPSPGTLCNPNTGPSGPFPPD